jgi:hypothetical protein
MIPISSSTNYQMESQSESELEPDFDDAALANAEAEVLASVAPVNKDCFLPPLQKGSLFDDKQNIRFAVLRAESSLGRDYYVSVFTCVVVTIALVRPSALQTFEASAGMGVSSVG